jgi:hypothetical protein
MAKTYTELEAWAIFIGALIIGIVLTSVFWAYITIPEEEKLIEFELENVVKSIHEESNATDAAEIANIDAPEEFILFCDKLDGVAEWGNAGYRQCIVKKPTEKNLVVMNLLCKKFNLTLSYGSFGVKCEGTV